jgi:hypothetical protein
MTEARTGPIAAMLARAEAAAISREVLEGQGDPKSPVRMDTEQELVTRQQTIKVTISRAAAAEVERLRRAGASDTEIKKMLSLTMV